MQNESVMRISVGDTDEPLRIVQITDCHLGETPGEKLVGMDTDESLDYILSSIRVEQSHARLLLATGDLSNDGGSGAYQRLSQKLDGLQLPYAWLAGNHDSRSEMIDAVGESRLPRIISLGSWAIIMLDSAVPGQVGGELGAVELELLENILQSLGEQEHLLVCLHHQPVPIGCDWLDQQQLADSQALFGLLAGEKRLRAIVWGHVHQEFCSEHPLLPGTSLISTPSTCVQFAVNSPDFKIDNSAPGYRWFDLHADGKLDTGIQRLQGVELGVDIDSTGY